MGRFRQSSAGAASRAKLKIVADPKDKLSENVVGRYYVDVQCIDCDVCRVTAPANFQRDEAKGYSFVFRQPGNVEEEAQCQEAMDSCPVEAIGKDGLGSS